MQWNVTLVSFPLGFKRKFALIEIITFSTWMVMEDVQVHINFY